MSLVSFIPVNSRSRKKAKKAIQSSLNLINYSLPRTAKTIVIKPNLCYYWDYSTGQTTDPEFVAALIELIKENAPSTNVSIIESDASAMKCKYAFNMLGYKKLQEEYNINLVNLSEEKCVPTQVVVGGKSFKILVPQIIQSADLKINVPKIKYMTGSCKITCALKNLYGCNPDPKKFKYHSVLAETIVALNKAMPFDLCLVDNYIASGVQPWKLGLVMASTDPVAVDTKAAWIAGVNPKQIRYLKLAEQEGLGSTTVKSVGTSPALFRARYPKRSPSSKLRSHIYKLIVLTGMSKKIGLE